MVASQELKHIQRRVFVSGQVQGVGFRAYIQRAAAGCRELRGYVRNLDDGRVEAVFSGSPDEVLGMVAWCKTGPSQAEVSALEVIEERVDSSLCSFGVR
jgi:acylphosphatase